MCYLHIWPCTLRLGCPWKWQIVKGHYNINLKVRSRGKKLEINCERVDSLLSGCQSIAGREYTLCWRFLIYYPRLCCEQFMFSENKESWSSKSVNCIIIPSFIRFFIMVILISHLLAIYFSILRRLATPINTTSLGGITTHSCTGRELFYSGSQLLGVYLSFVITIQ